MYMMLSQLLLSLFFLYISYSTVAYDPILAKYYVNAVQSTYCISDPTKWNCITCDKNMIPEYVVENNGVRSIQGYDKENNVIFTLFRGSSNIQNWIDNIQISKISPYNDTSISIEKGFYKAYEYVEIDLLKNVNNLSLKYSANNIIIAGHSLGGALATLFAYSIVSNYNKYNILNLFTYGSPRVGNNNFVKSFIGYNIPSYRITHHYDMVPHVPEELLGYLHIPNEIWYNEDNSHYKLCNDYNIQEDTTCSDSCSPIHCTSTSDHVYYLNVSLGNDPVCFSTTYM